MKDIDFDELDRAVSSVMGNDDARTNDAPVQSTAPTTQFQSAVTTPSPVAAPAVRRNGQFMDVVRPSSNMTRIMAAGKALPTKPAPLMSDIAAVPLAAGADTPVSIEEPSVEEVSAPLLSPTPEKVIPAPDEIIPDAPAAPVDTQPSDQSPAYDQAESEKEPDTVIIPTVPSVEPPLTTPFLSDTKVDKRPLGGYQLEDAPEAENEELTDDPKPTPEVIPSELSSEIMQVEADEEPEQTANVAFAQPAAIDPAPTASTISGSIPQQYHEEPSSGDAASGALYDTGLYHQPIDHPAKGKSHWIVWIVILMILGAALGGAAYYFSTGGKLF